MTFCKVIYTQLNYCIYAKRAQCVLHNEVNILIILSEKMTGFEAIHVINTVLNQSYEVS